MTIYVRTEPLGWILAALATAFLLAHVTAQFAPAWKRRSQFGWSLLLLLIVCHQQHWIVFI